MLAIHHPGIWPGIYHPGICHPTYSGICTPPTTPWVHPVHCWSTLALPYTPSAQRCPCTESWAQPGRKAWVEASLRTREAKSVKSVILFCAGLLRLSGEKNGKIG